MRKSLLTGLLIILVVVVLTGRFFYTPYEIEISNDYCEQINTSDMKNTCLAMVEKNFSICQGEYYFEDYCYHKLFEINKNFSESFCKNFSDYYPRIECFIWLAKQEKDASICEKADLRRQQCYWEIAKLLGKPVLCEEIESECERYQCLAESTGNISYCEKVPDVSEKIKCFGVLGENISACEMYVREYGEIISSPRCKYELAKLKNDVSLCWNIKHKETKWKCIAELNATEKVCDKAETQFWRDYCLVEVLKTRLS